MRWIVLLVGLSGIGWLGGPARTAEADEDAVAAEAIEAGLEAGWAHFRAARHAEAARAFEQAAALAAQADEATLLVEALSLAARAHLAAGDREAGLPHLERAGTLASPAEPRAWSSYLAVRGRFAWKADEREKATETFEELYAYCIEHGLFERAVDAAHMVAITGTPEQQVAWAKKGIAAAEEGGLEGWLGPLWNNLGVTHEDAGRPQEALEAYRRAREHHWKVGSERNKLIADWAIGHALRLCGQLEEAAAWLRPVLAWAERRHALEADGATDEWVGLALRELGYVAREQGREEDALRDLRRARPLLAGAGMPTWDRDAWDELVAAIRALEGGEATPGSTDD